jgi:solute carrier family 13 (sodium-dependent dicarboxylate transporter), member 2/3/5
MTARSIGLWLGLAGLIATLVLPAPAGMPVAAWSAAGLLWIMALWWMTEAIPLSATALLPFIVLPMTGVADANKTAAAYYSPTIILFIGGAFLALAIERTGLHRRLAVFLMRHAGDTRWRLLLAVMTATALLSALISNTSTALIMMPMALAMLHAGGVEEGETSGIAGALPMGIAFAASIGGLGTIIGTPTNTIAAGLLNRELGLNITFVSWLAFGIPMVLLGVPLAAWIIARVQRIGDDEFDPVAARSAIGHAIAWTEPEKRLMPLVLMALAAWIAQPWLSGLFPKDGVTDGTIAAIFGLALFMIPDGTGRPLLVWSEANRAPWDVVLMFGGGLAMAMGMTSSGLAAWMGTMLMPLAGVPVLLVALLLVAFVILITEFASNIATATGILPVVAALVVAMGADPILLGLPAALAATWGFMLPAGTGPNAIAWGTGHLAMRPMLRAGFALDVAGVFLIVGVVWAVAAIS